MHDPVKQQAPLDVLEVEVDDVEVELVVTVPLVVPLVDVDEVLVDEELDLQFVVLQEFAMPVIEPFLRLRQLSSDSLLHEPLTQQPYNEPLVDVVVDEEVVDPLVEV